jgi:hypothetical protein
MNMFPAFKMKVGSESGAEWWETYAKPGGGQAWERYYAGQSTTPKELAQDLVDFFNSTLRPNDLRRHLVEVIELPAGL